MKGLRFWLIAAVAVIICGACVITCYYQNNDNAVVTAQYIPKAPDYTDTTMWIIEDGDSEGTGADIFYVVSTWEKDWMTADSAVCHYADVWSPTHRERMAIEMNRVACNYYEYGYRHGRI